MRTVQKLNDDIHSQCGLAESSRYGCVFVGKKQIDFRDNISYAMENLFGSIHNIMHENIRQFRYNCVYSWISQVRDRRSVSEIEQSLFV